MGAWRIEFEHRTTQAYSLCSRGCCICKLLGDAAWYSFLGHSQCTVCVCSVQVPGEMSFRMLHGVLCQRPQRAACICCVQVPGEMFTLAMEAKGRGMGVVGSTSNILDFIALKVRARLREVGALLDLRHSRQRASFLCPLIVWLHVCCACCEGENCSLDMSVRNTLASGP